MTLLGSGQQMHRKGSKSPHEGHGGLAGSDLREFADIPGNFVLAGGAHMCCAVARSVDSKERLREAAIRRGGLGSS